MKIQELNETKMNAIIEAFTDYVGQYYDRDEPADISSIVRENFEEFTVWAYDDFVINELERETLLSANEYELHIHIIRQVIREFKMALKSR